jgi:hypothetical protein
MEDECGNFRLLYALARGYPNKLTRPIRRLKIRNRDGRVVKLKEKIPGSPDRGFRIQREIFMGP